MYIYVYMVLKAYVNFSACVCAFDAVVVVVSCYVYFYVFVASQVFGFSMEHPLVSPLRSQT